MPDLTSLKLVEITDRELLGVLVDVADGDGYADPQDIANRLKLKHDNPVACVRGRLAWLGRYGMVERDEDGRWGLSDDGRMLYSGRMKASAERALKDMGEGETWALASYVTRQYSALGQKSATMVRRDFQHQFQRRNR